MGGGQKGIWATIIKLHLLRQEQDGLALLKGTRYFILQLNSKGKASLGKVCKSYHAIARKNLSVKIKSDNLKGITTHHLFKEILESGFLRNHDFEVTDVQKNTLDSHAFIVAPTS